MNKEVKVGNYVRFKDKRGNNYIRKIIEVCETYPKKSWGSIIVDTEANNVSYVSSKNIIKSSPNIIDLIEIGDYVNGYKVVEIGWYLPLPEEQQKYLKVDCSRLFNALYVEDIESIVTKEQFKNMEYRIGDK